MVPATKISRNGKEWNMINFTDCETTKARYGGANGGKLGIIYHLQVSGIHRCRVCRNDAWQRRHKHACHIP